MKGPNFRIKRLFFYCVLLSSLTAYSCTEDSSPSDTISGSGTLIFYANGEGFVADGFTSEDDWEISFDNVYVTLSGITAYQAPVRNHESNAKHAGHDHNTIPEGSEHVALDGEYFLDLKAYPLAFEAARVEGALEGNYNYLTFNMVKATAETSGVAAEAVNYSLVMIGTAKKSGVTVDFTLKFDEELAFYDCGPQETYDGVLEDSGEASTEMTFHFDHIFGDAEEGVGAFPTDPQYMSYWGIGFDPFARIAGALDSNGDPDPAGSPYSAVILQPDMELNMNNAIFFQLKTTMTTLGHLVEAHCNCEELAEE